MGEEHEEEEAGVMDTSKEYIKMCEKADEIQNYWKKGGFSDGLGDIFYVKKKIKVCPKCSTSFQQFASYCYFDGSVLNGEHESTLSDTPENEEPGCINIWLPRQDQLQYMLAGDGSFSQTYNAKFHHFLNNNSWSRATQYERAVTYEQLWLAFVMHEKHKKSWNGEEWLIDE